MAGEIDDPSRHRLGHAHFRSDFDALRKVVREAREIRQRSFLLIIFDLPSVPQHSAHHA